MARQKNVPKSIASLLLLFFLANSLCIFSAYGDNPSTRDSGSSTPSGEQNLALVIKDGIPIVHLKGTPEETGKQYGLLLKNDLLNLNEMLSVFLAIAPNNKFLDMANKFEENVPVEYIAEMKALSKASGVPYDRILALNTIPKLACSTIAVWGDLTTDGDLIMGRNVDYFSFGYSEKESIVTIWHSDNENSVLSVNYLGMVGAYTGINDKGVCFGNMLVLNSNSEDISYNGTSIQILMRMAAQKCSTADEFASYLINRDHATPVNVMVADRTKAIVIEIGTERKSLRNPSGGENYIVATNYFRRKGMFSQEVNCQRYNYLIDSVLDKKKKYDVDTMEKALFNAIIEGINIQAVVFEPAKSKIHISINKNPAAAGPYTSLDIKELFDFYSSKPQRQK